MENRTRLTHLPESSGPVELVEAQQECNLEESLVDHFNKLAHDTTGEVFVDGMESAFSYGITLAVETHGDIAVRAMERLMSSNGVNVEVAGEILRQMGSMEDPRTHRGRLAVLTSSLKSPDPRLRDAASIGLAALDDPAAIEDLRDAVDREAFPQLRRNLTLALDQLQAAQWPTS